MAKSKKTLLDSVREAMNSSRIGWFERMPPEAQAELLEVRAQFQAGALKSPPWQMCRFIVTACQERGWAAPGQNAVLTWLRKN